MRIAAAIAIITRPRCAGSVWPQTPKSATRAAVNGVIGLRVPRDVIKARQAPYLVHGTPWYRPGLLRVAHVNLSVDDVEAARRFYGEVMGLSPAPRPADAAPPSGCHGADRC